MATSQNGWPALAGDSSKLYTWLVPAKNGHFKIRLRNGSAGFLLVHWLLWFSERVEDLTGGQLDDWGYAYRPIRGDETGLSNHSSGTAVDMNATRHPLGAVNTFKLWQRIRIRARLKAPFYGTLRWGGDYRNRKDEMHVEINAPLDRVEKRARRLMKTDRGQRVLNANPSQRRVILS
jgi:D-alanyl-D-alanine carboxypeptidase